MPKKTHLSKAPEYQPGVEIEGFNSVVRDLVAVAGSKKARSWGHPRHPAWSSVDYIVVAYVVVATPTLGHIKRNFHPLLHHHYHRQENPPQEPRCAHSGAFIKPIHFLIEVLKIIPHRIKTRNVPRLKNCKGRMELAMDLAMDLEEGEGFSAGKVA